MKTVTTLAELKTTVAPLLENLKLASDSSCPQSEAQTLRRQFDTFPQYAGERAGDVVELMGDMRDHYVDMVSAAEQYEEANDACHKEEDGTSAYEEAENERDNYQQEWDSYQHQLRVKLMDFNELLNTKL
jgi:hypothetical protein